MLGGDDDILGEFRKILSPRGEERLGGAGGSSVGLTGRMLGDVNFVGDFENTLSARDEERMVGSDGSCV